MQNIAEIIFSDEWSYKIKDFEYLDEKLVWKLVQDSTFSPLIDENFSVVKDQDEIFQFSDDNMHPHIRTKKRFAVHHHGDVMDRTALL